MTWTLEGKPLRSILVTRLRYLGDVVMSTVVLEILRRGDPEVKLGYLCEDPYAVVLAGHPLIDHLHRLGIHRKGSDAGARGMGRAVDDSASGFFTTVGRLRAAHYDLAVDLFFNPRSALLLRVAGIPARIGGTRSSRRRLYTHSVDRTDSGLSEAEWETLAPGGLGDHLSRLAPLRHLESGLGFGPWLRTFAAAGPLLPFVAAPGGTEGPVEPLGALGVDSDRPYILLAPGATWTAKQWPQARWRNLCERLARGRREHLVILVPPGEHFSGTKLGEGIPACRGGVLPPLDLETALRVLAGSRAVVCVDGGIMHAAVGLRVPTVALFGPTEPEIWFPYGQDHRFVVLSHRPPCHPCHLHECAGFSCLPSIGPQEVDSALSAVLRFADSQERPEMVGVETSPEISTQSNHGGKL